MTRVVLSVGSNLGDRLSRLQAVLDALGPAARAVSPVFETDPWGGVDQDAFLNAVIVAEDDDLDAHGWLRRAQDLETANDRVRDVRWGPRTLDVDVICCFDGDREILSADPVLTLPHPRAHQRAFVLMPWLAMDPTAELTVGGATRPVGAVLSGLDDAERSGVRETGLRLVLRR